MIEEPNEDRLAFIHAFEQVQQADKALRNAKAAGSSAAGLDSQLLAARAVLSDAADQLPGDCPEKAIERLRAGYDVRDANGVRREAIADGDADEIQEATYAAQAAWNALLGLTQTL